NAAITDARNFTQAVYSRTVEEPPTSWRPGLKTRCYVRHETQPRNRCETSQRVARGPVVRLNDQFVAACPMRPDGMVEMPSGAQRVTVELPWRTIAKVLAAGALVWVWLKTYELVLLVVLAVLLAVT